MAILLVQLVGHWGTMPTPGKEPQWSISVEMATGHHNKWLPLVLALLIGFLYQNAHLSQVYWRLILLHLASSFCLLLQLPSTLFHWNALCLEMMFNVRTSYLTTAPSCQTVRVFNWHGVSLSLDRCPSTSHTPTSPVTGVIWTASSPHPYQDSRVTNTSTLLWRLQCCLT